MRAAFHFDLKYSPLALRFRSIAWEWASLPPLMASTLANEGHLETDQPYNGYLLKYLFYYFVKIKLTVSIKRRFLSG
jgi:hypothetical protein